MNKENVFKQSTKQGKLDRLAYYMWKMRSPNYSDYTNSLVKAKQMVEEINFYGFMVGLVSRELTGIPTNVQYDEDEPRVELEEMAEEGLVNVFHNEPMQLYNIDFDLDKDIIMKLKKAEEAFIEAFPKKKKFARETYSPSVYNNTLGLLLKAAIADGTTVEQRKILFEDYFDIMKSLTEITYKKIEEEYLKERLYG